MVTIDITDQMLPLEKAAKMRDTNKRSGGTVIRYGIEAKTDARTQKVMIRNATT